MNTIIKGAVIREEVAFDPFHSLRDFLAVLFPSSSISYLIVSSYVCHYIEVALRSFCGSKAEYPYQSVCLPKLNLYLPSFVSKNNKSYLRVPFLTLMISVFRIKSSEAIFLYIDSIQGSMYFLCLPLKIL